MAGWWPGDGNANDIAGGNNGSFNGAGTAPGLVGDAFSFNGSGAYVSVSHDGSLDFSRELTLDAWIFIDSDAPANMGIVSKYYPVDDHRAYFLGIENNKLKLRASANGTSSVNCDQVSANDVPRGEWVHVATTVSSSACTLYVNGGLVSTTAGIPNIAVTGNVPNLIIGAHGFGDLAHFKGLIDEVEAFDRALSQAEIQAIYDAGANGKCKDQACATPPPDMVSWYRAENDANDSQGENDGTLQGAPGFVAGKVGQAFSLNGSDQYISLGNPASLQLTSAITIDAWINPNDFGEGELREIVSKWGQNFNSCGTGTSADSFIFSLYKSGGAIQPIFYIHLPPTNEPSIIGGNTPAGVFSHVAATYDSATGIQALYVNGALVASQSLTPSAMCTSDATVAIGAEGAGAQRFFPGVIDEVEIFNRALTATEIKEIYDAGANGKCAAVTVVPGTCPPSPQEGCAIFSRGELHMTNSADNARDRLGLWALGSTTAGFFGDPATGGVSHSTCLYDSGGTLLTAMEVAAGGNGPDGKPYWKFQRDQATYENRLTNDAGVRRVRQVSGALKISRFDVNGQGSNLALPALGAITPTVKAQHITSLGTCAEITFDAVTVNPTNGKVRAREP
jgi:hypothetical protein